MISVFDLTVAECHCLGALANDNATDRECTPGVIDRLQARGLLDVIVQGLPMFPQQRRYRLTPLGRHILNHLPDGRT